MGKILLMVAIGLTAVSAVLGVVNHGKLADARKEASASSAALASEKANTSKVADSVKKINDQVKELTAKQEEATTALTTAQTSATKAAQQLQELQTQIGGKDTQITQLQEDNKAKEARIAELTNGTTKVDPEKTALSDQLKEQIQLNTIANEKLSKQEGQLKVLQDRELHRIAGTMKNGLEGTISAVNPAWNFVILNIGDRNGIVNNSEMLIKRGTQLIGKVRITSVERGSSVADIVANSVPKGVTVQPGDRVIYQGAADEAAEQQ